jgi:hypothetical protein
MKRACQPSTLTVEAGDWIALWITELPQGSIRPNRYHWTVPCASPGDFDRARGNFWPQLGVILIAPESRVLRT